MANEIEAVEKAPNRCKAEGKATRPQDLPDHQHPDELVLFFDQIAADRYEDADNRNRRHYRDQIFKCRRNQLMFEAVDRADQKPRIEETQPNHAPVVTFPSRSANHVKLPCSDDKFALRLWQT